MPRDQISIVQILLTNVSYAGNAIYRKITIPRLNSAYFTTIAFTIASGTNIRKVISGRFMLYDKHGFQRKN